MGVITKVRARYRYSVILLRQLVKTDFKLRYQGSVLGYVWSLLRPLLLFLILYLVFTVFLPLGKGVPHYPVYLLLGVVLWTFFTDVTSGGLKSIVEKGALLRKINFPKYNVVLAVSLAALINLGFNLIVVAIFMLFNGVALTWNALLLLPLLIELYVAALGLAFLLSALYVHFRDMSYIWEVLIQAGFYATPIIYPLSRVHNQLIRELIILNPLAQIIQDARYVLVTPSTLTVGGVYSGNAMLWLVPILLTIGAALLGAWYFRAHSRLFAEEV